MSVTISIQNVNEIAEYSEFECLCVFDDKADDKCPTCSGTGKDRFPNYKWEMNLANGNFYQFWNSLALPHAVEYGGSIDARIVLDALKGYDCELNVRKERVSKGENGATMIECGTDLNYAEMRFRQLRDMATEAEKREEMIQWG